jgi:hypothetical protein
MESKFLKEIQDFNLNIEKEFDDFINILLSDRLRRLNFNHNGWVLKRQFNTQNQWIIELISSEWETKFLTAEFKRDQSISEYSHIALLEENMNLVPSYTFKFVREPSNLWPKIVKEMIIETFKMAIFNLEQIELTAHYDEKEEDNFVLDASSPLELFGYVKKKLYIHLHLHSFSWHFQKAEELTKYLFTDDGFKIEELFYHEDLLNYLEKTTTEWLKEDDEYDYSNFEKTKHRICLILTIYKRFITKLMNCQTFYLNYMAPVQDKLNPCPF